MQPFLFFFIFDPTRLTKISPSFCCMMGSNSLIFSHLKKKNSGVYRLGINHVEEAILGSSDDCIKTRFRIEEKLPFFSLECVVPSTH